jgi:hypothetical protein
VLRRLLREADRELFLARQLQAQRERPVGRQNGPSEDVMRRFLRDADRTNYELRQAVEARLSSQRQRPSTRAPERSMERVIISSWSARSTVRPTGSG